MTMKLASFYISMRNNINCADQKGCFRQIKQSLIFLRRPTLVKFIGCVSFYVENRKLPSMTSNTIIWLKLSMVYLVLENQISKK